MRFPQGSNPAAHAEGGVPARQIDRVALRLLNIERRRELSRRLRLPVAIDASGWLTDEIEISIQTQRDRTIWPIRLLVGPMATDLLLVDRAAIHGRCAAYNDVLGRLRELKRQIAALVQDGQVGETSPLARAHAELAYLDGIIVSRQCARMGHGAVRLHVLIEEIAILRGHEDRFALVVTEYERRRAPRTRRRWLRA